MVEWQDIQEMARIIAERFRPRKIILFGSHARGQGGANSDVDLLIVMDTDAPPHRRALPIRRALWDFACPKDILVRTPAEFERARRQFWNVVCPADREGKVLYERPA